MALKKTHRIQEADYIQEAITFKKLLTLLYKLPPNRWKRES